MRLSATKTGAANQYRGFGTQLWDLAGSRPSLDLNFADNKSLVDGTTGQNLVTFTRASSGTYVGSDGLIKTATTNEPRFDHNPTTGESLGLLVEEQRTNLLLRSEEFDDASWTKQNVTATVNQTTAPDNSVNADLIAGNAGTATKHVLGSYSASTSGTFTFSVFAKAGTESFIVVRIADQTGANDVRQRFNLSSGTLNGSIVTGGTATAGSSSINSVGNGWYRCVVTATFAAFTQLRGHVWLNDYAPVSLTTNFYLWGAQLEAGSFPTSYIPTTSATVTRAADVASITGSNFSSWYNQPEGTLSGEFAAATYSTASLAISDGTNSNRLLIYRGSVGTRYIITDAGVTQSGGAQTPYTLNTFIRVALGYKLNDCNLAVSTQLQALDVSATIPSAVDRLLIGTNATGSGHGNGPIRRLTYWPTRLSDTTLQAITT